jgi:hypothetical protein
MTKLRFSKSEVICIFLKTKILSKSGAANEEQEECTNINYTWNGTVR